MSQNLFNLNIIVYEAAKRQILLDSGVAADLPKWFSFYDGG